MCRSKEKEEVGNGLLGRLVEEGSLPDDSVADFIINLLFAGNETTAKTMLFAVYFLTHSPNAMAQLLVRRFRTYIYSMCVCLYLYFSTSMLILAMEYNRRSKRSWVKEAAALMVKKRRCLHGKTTNLCLSPNAYVSIFTINRTTMSIVGVRLSHHMTERDTHVVDATCKHCNNLFFLPIFSLLYRQALQKYSMNSTFFN